MPVGLMAVKDEGAAAAKASRSPPSDYSYYSDDEEPEEVKAKAMAPSKTTATAAVREVKMKAEVVKKNTEPPSLENGGLVVLDPMLMSSLALAEEVMTERAVKLQAMLKAVGAEK